MRNAYKILIGSLKERHLGDKDIDGMMILIWILQKYGVKVWPGRVEGPCDRGKENCISIISKALSSIISRALLGCLTDRQLLNNNS
jgi:hypothetical protein